MLVRVFVAMRCWRRKTAAAICRKDRCGGSDIAVWGEICAAPARQNDDNRHVVNGGVGGTLAGYSASAPLLALISAR